MTKALPKVKNGRSMSIENITPEGR